MNAIDTTTTVDIRFDSNGWSLAGTLRIPGSHRAGDQAPAIVVSHPFGGVKEQTAGLYAAELAARGFVTLAFDASYQGESEGQPRGLENPFARVEDIKSAVSLLSIRAEVDPERIGALGICASGGYVPFAAQTEHRIKAVATVSALDIGSMMCEGLGGTQPPEVIQAMLDEAGAARTAEALGQAPRLEPILPDTAEEAAAAPPMGREGYDYYRTPRAAHPRSTNRFVFRSIDLIAQYSSYEAIALISPRPLLMIAGTRADTAYFSRGAIERAREPKELFWVDGATHFDLYDKPEYVPLVVGKLAEFFALHLTPSTVHS
ncbi:alpha/beta hydrolase [Nocardia sp. NBC_01388]|uniref:alpha/beta hydrolase n=1 Tax=Nocardia sp. NBC_01388 TaxID=2903596 RepID=UPI003246FCDE